MNINIRGLRNFISELRNCKNNQSESKRVEEEISKIRKAFHNPSLSSYDRRKYTLKLLLIHILGQEVDFGQNQMATLILSEQLEEKVSGYTACNILLTECHEAELNSIHAEIQRDLRSKDEKRQSFALAFIGNFSHVLFSEVFAKPVYDLIVSQEQTKLILIKKKAINVFVKLINQDKSVLKNFSMEKLEKIVNAVLKERSVGLQISMTNLAFFLVKQGNDLTRFVPMIVENHVNIVNKTDYEIYKDYNQQQCNAPWLQIKYLKLLSVIQPVPTSTVIIKITDLLNQLFTSTCINKSVNKNNIEYSILFESFGVLSNQKDQLQEDIRNKAAMLLCKFISIKEPNIRYLGIDWLCRLVYLRVVEPSILHEHIEIIKLSLTDFDISIRRKTCDLLQQIADERVVEDITNILIEFLKEYSLVSQREEIILKISIMSEKQSKSLKQQVDTILRLIAVVGDQVSDDVANRLIQVITGFGESKDEKLQKQACEKLYYFITKFDKVHFKTIRIATYILPEFGQLMEEKNSLEQQQNALINWQTKMDQLGKISLMSSLTKLAIQEPKLLENCQQVLNKARNDIEPEMQQRALEQQDFLEKQKSGTFKDEIDDVFDAMPTYSSEIMEKNVLLNVLNKKEKFATQVTDKKDEIKTNISSTTPQVQPEINKNIENKNNNNQATAKSNVNEDNLIDF